MYSGIKAKRPFSQWRVDLPKSRIWFNVIRSTFHLHKPLHLHSRYTFFMVEEIFRALIQLVHEKYI